MSVQFDTCRRGAWAQTHQGPTGRGSRRCSAATARPGVRRLPLRHKAALRQQCPSSSEPAARWVSRRVLAIPGKASALARRRLAPASGRLQQRVQSRKALARRARRGSQLTVAVLASGPMCSKTTNSGGVSQRPPGYVSVRERRLRQLPSASRAPRLGEGGVSAGECRGGALQGCSGLLLVDHLRQPIHPR